VADGPYWTRPPSQIPQTAQPFEDVDYISISGGTVKTLLDPKHNIVTIKKMMPGDLKD
jgi:hypothetical protein